MNKKTSILLVILFIILIGVVYYWNFLRTNQKDSYGCFVLKGYYWCDFKNKCIKSGEEDCSLTQDWILNEAKKIIGLDLNIMPNQTIKWKTKDNELAFSAIGIYYTDLLRAEKVIKGFKDWDNFLNKIGFKNDPYNPVIVSDKENIVKYSKEKIICVLTRIDNPNNSSSLSLFCGNTDDKLCAFKSNCGRECKTTDDCGLFTDGCAKIIVCRNKNYKFYQDCANPASIISELDRDINQCECLENQCVPKNEKFRSKN
jgi:hypothetical protein